ncbi:hypothetical protein FB107DRAFT_202958 [Schizophyllum commune]
MSSGAPKLDEVKNKCRVCGDPTSMRCSRCHIVYYCSKEHIAQDWKKHRPGCNPGAPAASAQDDTDNRRTLQAILLPVNEDTPRLIDVVSEKKYDEVIDSTWYECKLAHLYPKTSFPRDLPIQTMGINGPTLEGDRCISMIYDDKSLINGSPVNRCVQRLTNGKAQHRWSGNLVVLRLHPHEFVATKHRSVNMNEDLVTVRRYLEDYLTVIPNSSFF